MKKRILALVLAAVLFLGLGPKAVSVRADGDDAVDVAKSIQVVIDAVDSLKDVIKPEEASVISTIFSGFMNAYSQAGSLIAPGLSIMSFLKLTGLMKDGTAEALADIQAQLTLINEKLARMDNKLDILTEQMNMMKAGEDYNARAIKANQMLEAWHHFETSYVEDRMDELMRQYSVMLNDALKLWIENKTEGIRTDGDVYTDRVLLFYKYHGPLPEDSDTYDKEISYELQVTDANGFVSGRRADAAAPDPYAIYEDEYDSRVDRYLILDETFFPAKGEMTWNVNTWRESLKAFILNRMNSCIEAGDYSHFKAWNYPAFTAYGDADRTPELLEETAEEAANQIVYRICSNEINRSSDFASKVSLQFKEYCDHLRESINGVDAMLKTMYLTHAFEFEVAEDLKAFLDQMAVKTGVYGLMAVNVTGMSRSVTDTDKAAVTEHLCRALDYVKDSAENGLTGNGRYCYVTSTLLEYSNLTLSSSEEVYWRHRGAYKAYRSSSGGSIHTDVKLASGETGMLIGDSNAVLLSYILKGTGAGTLNHAYMNEHLAVEPQTDYKGLVTTLNGETRMEASDSIRLESENIIGGYFEGNPKVYLNALPGSAEFGYLDIRKTITGTLYDPESIKLTVNHPLFGIAAYGENHNLWVVDESAVLGGPCDLPGFSSGSSTTRTDSDVIGNIYYTTAYQAAVTYNCLLSVPAGRQDSVSGYNPLEELEAFVKQELPSAQEHVHDWDEGTVTREPSDTEPGIITYVCRENPDHIRHEIYPEKTTVALTFDPAGGIFREQTGPYVMHFEKNSEILLPEGPEKENHTFLYWDSESYPEDTAYLAVEDHTFTAVYAETPVPSVEPEPSVVPEPGSEEEPAVFQLTFDLGGGTLEGKSGILTIEAEKGSTITIPGAPEKDGFTFLCWEGSEYYPGDKYVVTEAHAFTAKWQENGASNTPGKVKNTPGTGDAADNAPWLVLLAAASCVLAAAAVKKKRM